MTELRAASARPAFFAALAVAGCEYFFRHFALFWLPTLGSLKVNDLASLLMAYGLMATIAGTALRLDWRLELRAVRDAFIELVTGWAYMPWILAIMVALLTLPVLDRVLWGGYAVPMWVAAYRNPAAWVVPPWLPLALLAAIAVNGILVPIVEELLWRGVVQEGLLARFHAPVAIGVTAVLFSLKHVLVDASWGRFLTLVAFGTVCGIVARRRTWHGSAAVHLFVNTVTTAVGALPSLP